MPEPRSHSSPTDPDKPGPGVQPIGSAANNLQRLSDAAKVAEERLHEGEPLIAYDTATEALKRSPADVRLRQLQGLALARSGASQRAIEILKQLHQEGQTDEETLGMLGRAHKDLAANAADASEREIHLRESASTYAQAYAQSGGYWTGINAATMSLLTGDADTAARLAGDVREKCIEALRRPDPDNYWLFAALGEAGLISRDWPQAEDWYARAAKVADHRYADLQSSRRNARLILRHWNQNSSNIDNLLHVPPVVVFAGHMIDQPGRAAARFPAELEDAVGEAIRSEIDRIRPGFGYSAAACGSDILFLEAMLEAGAEVSIVLPSEKEAFVRDSVDVIPGSNWRERFERVMEHASCVVIASTQQLTIGGVAYDFCNEMISGLGAIRARQLETELHHVAVWDGNVGDGPGGAASAARRWGELGHDPKIIDLAKIAGRATARGAVEVVASLRAGVAFESRPTNFSARIVAVLFADAVGFSKLSEEEVPRFVEHFLGAIAKLVNEFGGKVLAKNTWGDGLYVVFTDVDSAGEFALKIVDVMSATNWKEKGLPPDLSLRIGLHAGPVYVFTDPITQSPGYSGTHVSRAARIEPITPAGQVYASEAFAALSAAERVRGFTCDYVGRTPMAKGYGTFPTYHVRRQIGPS